MRGSIAPGGSGFRGSVGVRLRTGGGTACDGGRARAGRCASYRRPWADPFSDGGQHPSVRRGQGPSGLVRSPSKKPKPKSTRVSEINRARVSDYPRVADFLVESFYTDSRNPENNLSPGMQSSLVRDQNMDLRARYGRNQMGGGGLECAILTADTEYKETIGCVALGVTPFVGDAAQLAIRDLYNYPEDATLRPVVANLAVNPAARRRGIAKRLMREAEGVCKEWGYDEVWLLVEKDNVKARKLYGKLGYKVIRSEEDETYKLKEGRIVQMDCTNVYMRKRLGPLGILFNADYPRLFVTFAALAAVAPDETRARILAWIVEQAPAGVAEAIDANGLSDIASALKQVWLRHVL